MGYPHTKTRTLSRAVYKMVRKYLGFHRQVEDVLSGRRVIIGFSVTVLQVLRVLESGHKGVALGVLCTFGSMRQVVPRHNW